MAVLLLVLSFGLVISELEVSLVDVASVLVDGSVLLAVSVIDSVLEAVLSTVSSI